MNENPISRAEKIEILKERLNNGGVSFHWNGYPGILGKGDEKGGYPIFVFIDMDGSEARYLQIRVEGNMETISMEYLSGGMKALFSLDLNSLPVELRNCGPKIIEFILNQDWDASGELDGWVL